MKSTIRERERQVENLQKSVDESEQKRREMINAHKLLKDQHEELRLTLDERVAYIFEVEASSQAKDTEISLQRMGIEELTLWREKQLQLLRTEADIEAAKSKVLQGRNADRTLETLKNVNDKKNDG